MMWNLFSINGKLIYFFGVLTELLLIVTIQGMDGSSRSSCYHNLVCYNCLV
jgi:hypothetical protein